MAKLILFSKLHTSVLPSSWIITSNLRLYTPPQNYVTIVTFQAPIILSAESMIPPALYDNTAVSPDAICHGGQPMQQNHVYTKRTLCGRYQFIFKGNANALKI